MIDPLRAKEARDAPSVPGLDVAVALVMFAIAGTLAGALAVRPALAQPDARFDVADSAAVEARTDSRSEGSRADSLSGESRADSLPLGSRLPRVVRLAELLVRGARIHDPLSSSTVHLIPASVVRTLPIDRVSELFALEAGVVARGEELHVRGGRAGESRVLLRGIALNDPLRGRPMELPLLAVRDAELAGGGLDASDGGALAGVLRLRTLDPDERWSGEAQWHTDARTGTHYDRVGARMGGPIASTGLGAVASFEATLDDTHLPNLRGVSRNHILGSSFGWRADNRMLAHLKLATRPAASRFSLEVLGNRRVDRPFDPQWSLDGYTTNCIDPLSLLPCGRGAGYSPDPQSGYQRYRAADHHVMTDDRRGAGALAWERFKERRRFAVTLGWLGSRSVTSLDGREDFSYLDPSHFPVNGYYDSPDNDPFHVYLGDEPWYRVTATQRWTLRADDQRSSARGDVLQLGAGATYDDLALTEMDFSTPGFGLDSIRTYRAFAPGGWIYGHGRWVFEGLVANGGLRAEYFTSGPEAEAQSFPHADRGIWTLSPRLGVAYPISVRDVFSLSYVRVQQNPDRDYLYDNRERITNRDPLGNPALEPATAISYQAAVKHLFSPQWSMQGAVFFRDLYGLVGARNRAPARSAPLLQYANADDAHASGVEWTLLWTAASGNHAAFNYTFLEARGTASREEGVPFGPKLQERPESIGQHALDWDRRHSASLAWFVGLPGWGSMSLSTLVGSGLPWTPRARRQLEGDVSTYNTERFKWSEVSNASLRWPIPRWLPSVTLGVDVRNVFDSRSDLFATVDGYPNLQINTLYDDYGAYRTETGQPGGAYWNDRNGDGYPGWVPVHDPRLTSAPRTIRMGASLVW